LNYFPQIMIVGIFAFFVSFSLSAANSGHTIVLTLGDLQNDNLPSEMINDATLTLGVGEPFNVSVINEHATDVLLPAEPSACAIVTVEHRTNDSWQQWSNCDFRRQIDNPVFLAPGQAIDGTRRFRASKPTSSVAVGEKSRFPKTSVYAGELGKSQIPIDPGSGMIVVEQTQIETPPVPFFEKFRTLPAGEYQLVVSYALIDQPDVIRYARSSAFLVVDQAGDEN
jgi:hypothetical protein